MPFDPNLPAENSEMRSVEMRNQFNALHDLIATPKLPDYTTIANPEDGNIAFNYSNQTLLVFGGGEWMQIG